MKKLYFSISCLCLFFLPRLFAQTTISLYAFNSPNSTGYVMPDHSNHSGDMKDIFRYKNYGYMTFDLRTIPANATITAATLNFYVNGASTTVVVAYLGKLTKLPVVTSGAEVRYTEVSGGEVLSDNVPWDGVIGEKACSFNLAGIAAIQNRIGSFISCGLYPSQDTGNGYYNIIGYGGGTGTTFHAPYLTLTYNTGQAKKPATAFYANDATPYLNNPVQFFDNSGNYPTSWLWDFGDGTTSAVKNPEHTYSATGTYTVTLKASNTSGDSTLIKTNYMTVSDPPAAPMADFKADTTYVETGYSIQFSDSTKNQADEWFWNFGDGGTSTEQNPNYTYPAEGVYTVRLIVKGPGGRDTVEKEKYITVVDMLAAPMADFTYAADMLTVNFTDLSVNYPDKWLWDFDSDNNPGTYISTEQHPQFTYGSPGTYRACLTASNPAGSDQSCKTIEFIVGISSLHPGIIISPNPVSDRLSIYMDNLSAVEMKLVNMLGQEFRPAVRYTENYLYADVSALPKGVYLVKLQTGQHILNRPLVIR